MIFQFNLATSIPSHRQEGVDRNTDYKTVVRNLYLNSNAHKLKTINEIFETISEKVVTRAKIFVCSDGKIETIDNIAYTIKHCSETIVRTSHAINEACTQNTEFLKQY